MLTWPPDVKRDVKPLPKTKGVAKEGEMSP